MAPALLLLSGCAAVGPNYVAPKIAAPAVFPAATAADAAQIEPSAWWSALGDPDLSAAVRRALAANPELDVAAARIRQARAGLAGVAALQYPIGGLTALAGRGQDSRRSPEGELLSAFHAPIRSDLYAGVASIGWETDLFGAVRRGKEAKAAGVELEQQRLRATRVVLAAETGRAYATLRGLQIRRALLDQRLATAQRQLDLAQRRLAEGRASALDVRRGEAELAQLRLAVPALDGAITAALDALDTLEAQPLGASRALLSTPPSLPQALPARVLETPATVIARRPDVAAAERAVAEAHAGIGVAVAEYYPSVRLDALAGLSSAQSQHILDQDAGLSLGLVSLRWRLLDWKRIDADVAQAKGQYAEALAVYRGATLKAAGEIDSAMASLSASGEAIRQAGALQHAAAQAETLAQRGHDEGEIALTPVLEARARRLAAEDQVAASRLDAVLAAIDLYRALGLGAD